MTKRARLGAGAQHDIAMKVDGCLIHPARVMRFGKGRIVARTMATREQQRKYGCTRKAIN